jgi:hypothetical protein
MWEPRRLTILWAFTACYRDIFTLYMHIRTSIYRHIAPYLSLCPLTYSLYQEAFSRNKGYQNCSLTSIVPTIFGIPSGYYYFSLQEVQHCFALRFKANLEVFKAEVRFSKSPTHAPNTVTHWLLTDVNNRQWAKSSRHLRLYQRSSTFDSTVCHNWVTGYATVFKYAINSVHRLLLYKAWCPHVSARISKKLPLRIHQIRIGPSI